MSFQTHLTAVKRKKGEDRLKFKEGAFPVERRKLPRIRVKLPLDYSLTDSEETYGGWWRMPAKEAYSFTYPKPSKQELC
jgi:hypothetical protein